jgi:hypothetical protein
MQAKSVLSSGILTLVAVGTLAVASPAAFAEEGPGSSSSSSSTSSGNGAQCQSQEVVNGQVVSSSNDCAAAYPGWFGNAGAPNSSSSTSQDSSTSSSTSQDSSASTEGADTPAPAPAEGSTSESSSTSTGDGAQCQSQEVVNGQVVASSTDCAEIMGDFRTAFPGFNMGLF